jgi:hypothetical protein
MAIPYQWRSMPEVMAEIPELRGIGRGGSQQALKTLIDDARMRVVAKMGSDREQAVAYGLQARRGRRLQRTQVERRLLPVSWPVMRYSSWETANITTLPSSA